MLKLRLAARRTRDFRFYGAKLSPTKRKQGKPVLPKLLHSEAGTKNLRGESWPAGTARTATLDADLTVL